MKLNALEIGTKALGGEQFAASSGAVATRPHLFLEIHCRVASERDDSQRDAKSRDHRDEHLDESKALLRSARSAQRGATNQR